jgi:hypothetical protein
MIVAHQEALLSQRLSVIPAVALERMPTECKFAVRNL